MKNACIQIMISDSYNNSSLPVEKRIICFVLLVLLIALKKMSKRDIVSVGWKNRSICGSFAIGTLHPTTNL